MSKDDIIFFESEDLKIAINVTLGVEDQYSEITYGDLQQLTSFQYFHNKLVSLQGLQYANNLKHLTLIDCGIKSISVLANLDLESLTLTDNFIKDISYLQHMETLVDLQLNRNFINDLTPLAGLYNLLSLNIDDNKINDIRSLSELTNMKILNMCYNSVKNFKPLSKLKNLIVLDVGFNNFDNFNFLVNKSNLEYVNIESDLYEITNDDLIFLHSIVNSTGVELKYGSVAYDED